VSLLFCFVTRTVWVDRAVRTQFEAAETNRGPYKK
jgi:hypothetical protein